jgi:hypothetical protein
MSRVAEQPPGVIWAYIIPAVCMQLFSDIQAAVVLL